MGNRIETDSMGDVEVAADRYWGAQTQRSLQNFKIGGQRFGRPVIRAFGVVKKAAAQVNRELGKLDAQLADAHRARPPTRSMAGDARRPLPARRLADRQRHADEHERQRGHREPRERARRHAARQHDQGPDSSERSREHVAVVERRVPDRDARRGGRAHRASARCPPSSALRSAIEDKSEAFADVVKIGRTHMMDATPLTLGQEMSGWAAQLAFAEKKLAEALDGLSISRSAAPPSAPG